MDSFATMSAVDKSAQPKPRVLFVCVHNAGRSQMAAALTTELSDGRVDVRSAGSEPADAVNPVAVDAMKELGIDLTDRIARVVPAVRPTHRRPDTGGQHAG